MTTAKPAVASDLPAIVDLLASNGLPTADLKPGSAPSFWVLRRDEQIIGVIGLERFGSVGLLRSLAVSQKHRRTGLGLALTRALEAHAIRNGLQSLVLLTETAARFFEKLEYRVVARDSVPAAVQASAEFGKLCPASAVCMIKNLDAARH